MDLFLLYNKCVDFKTCICIPSDLFRLSDASILKRVFGYQLNVLFRSTDASILKRVFRYQLNNVICFTDASILKRVFGYQLYVLFCWSDASILKYNAFAFNFSKHSKSQFEIFYNLTAPQTVSNTYAQVARTQSCANHVQHI